MPFKKYKLPKRDSYRVVNADTGEVHAYETTKEKADAQLRLLRGIEHGWTPSGSKSKHKRKSSRKQKTRRNRSSTKRKSKGKK